jgi:hypothetical protein
VSAIVSSHRVFDGANHGAPAMYSGASGCSSMQMGPEGLLIKCGFGYSDVSRCIYAPGSSTPASPSGSSPRLRPHRAPVNPELTSQAFTLMPCARAVRIASTSSSVRRVRGRFFGSADAPINGSSASPSDSASAQTSALIPRGNQPLDPRSPVPATLHCFHSTSGQRRVPRASGGARRVHDDRDADEAQQSASHVVAVRAEAIEHHAPGERTRHEDAAVGRKDATEVRVRLEGGDEPVEIGSAVWFIR